MKFVGPEAEGSLDWLALTDALAEGHRRPEAKLGDTFLYRGDDTLLSRSAWIDGLGVAVKSITIYPGSEPPINGSVSLFSDEDGTLEAMVDFHLVTKWKTCADSLLAARRLARPDSTDILIVGAGTLAKGLREAYGALFPNAAFHVWNRTPERAAELAGAYPNTIHETDLEAAVRAADIVTCGTMSPAPVVKGEWLKPGTHLDLIGAYRPDMRETDNAGITAGRLFLDSRKTVIGHIGEVQIPMDDGVLSEGDVVADFYQLDRFERESAEEITVFKNGGGAHLDLMTARYVLGAAGH